MTGIVEIEAELFGALSALAAPMAAIHTSIAAVIAGAADGRIWVDSLDAPAVALIEGPEGTYLIGAALPPVAAAAAADLLDDWVYLHVDPRIAGAVGAALPNSHMVPHPRLTFRLQPGNHAIAVPPGLQLAVEPDGIGQILLDGDREVAHCRPDMVVGRRSEIGVWVHPDYRRRGTATALVAAALKAAAGAGLTDIGWHCHASNAGSAAIARRFAAAPPVETLAYSASLPAENAGDLGQTECLRLAAHFEAAEPEIAWLGFHAAGAWALAAEHDRALAAVERLVEGGWHGEPDWLTGHWALAGLREHPRFAAAIETLKKQKAPPG